MSALDLRDISLVEIRLTENTIRRLIGVFSAALFVTSIATSTLTQSVVSYPSRNVSIAEEGRARAWKIEHYYAWSTNPIAEGENSVPALKEDRLPQQSRQRSSFWALLVLVNCVSSLLLGTARRMEPVTMAIAQAIYTPVAADLSFREPECFATNCTWPRFSTLAMCYNMTGKSAQSVSASVQLSDIFVQTLAISSNQTQPNSNMAPI